MLTFLLGSRQSKSKDKTDESFCKERWAKPETGKKRKSYFGNTDDVPIPKKKTMKQRTNRSTPHCPWGGDFENHQFRNTCTIDNLLYIFHRLILERQDVRLWLQESTNSVSETLLRVSDLFSKNKWAEGKFVWYTEHVNETPKERINLFGTEVQYFVSAESVMQPNVSTQNCSNTNCGHPKTERTTFEILLP